MDADPGVRDTMAVDPRLLLSGPTPRLIDEWQTEPAIWNHVRRAVDDRPGLGHFILTGSAIPARRRDATYRGRSNQPASPPSHVALRNAPLHGTGVAAAPDERRAGGRRCQRATAGRRCRPDLRRRMAGASTPEFQAKRPCSPTRTTLARSVASTSLAPEASNAIPRESTGSCSRSRATRRPWSPWQRWFETPRDSDDAFTEQTARSYMAALEQLMVVEQLPAWAPHLRSRSRLRTSRKRHFVDPSLATAALGAGPEYLLRDIPWFGCLFESMVVRDLRVHAQALRAEGVPLP